MRVHHYAGEVRGVEKSTVDGHVRLTARAESGAYLYVDVPLEVARGLTPGDWVSGQFGSVVQSAAAVDDAEHAVGFLPGYWSKQ